MRRQQTIISQTEQIHQAIYYRFAALILFDDNENQQTTTTNNRHSLFKEWARRYQDTKGKRIFKRNNFFYVYLFFLRT
jgi:hypothetical protein